MKEKGRSDRKLTLLTSLTDPAMSAVLTELDAELDKAWKDPASRSRIASNIVILMSFRRGMTMQSLADQAGIDRSCVSRLASGTVKVGLHPFIGVARTLGVRVHTLMKLDLAQVIAKAINDFENSG